MRNLDERHAVGAVIKARYRRWIRPHISLNLSSGAVFLSGTYGERLPAFTGHVDLNYKDLIAPYIALDVVRDRGSVNASRRAARAPGRRSSPPSARPPPHRSRSLGTAPLAETTPGRTD